MSQGPYLVIGIKFDVTMLYKL